ncbi:MAG: V-type ATPase 116kDa subunit family protein [Thermodesulfobacteriota bacterium]|nr:V-type ATPase 116kDa subunit family protein [Thermodesulfobacteriota bacterium]
MVPIFINTPEPMMKVRVITFKDSHERTLKHLQKMGVLHVEKAKELEPIDREAIERDRNRARKALISIHDILTYLAGERTVFLTEGMKPQPLDEITNQIDKFYDRFSRLTEKTDCLKEETVELEKLGKYLGLLAREINVSLKDLQYSGSYIFTNVLAFSEEAYKTFSERSNQYLLQHVAVPVEGEVAVYFIASAENRKTIETLIRDLGVITFKIPDEELTLKEFMPENDEMLRRQKEDTEKFQKEIQEMIEENLDRIVFFREVLAAENERLSVLEQACEARYVTLIEGWVPRSNVDIVTSSLKEALDYVFVDTKDPDSMDKPPTRLQNPPGIRPFQVIVSLFSLPRYGDWDPTPIVAYFFAFFFGLMLNDVIYAIGLILLARFLLNKFVDDPTSEEFYLFRNVLYISGGVALLLGLLSGTYLGDFLNMYFNVDLKNIALVTHVQKHLSDPISFIILSLIIGLVHVNASHILALIRGIKERNKGLVLGKMGLFLIEIFGIPYIFKALLHVELFPLSAEVYSAFAYPLFLGLTLIVIASFMQMGGLGGIFWIFELTGIMGDIMSYSRLAGVGLATFYLASSFNLLSNWISSSLSNLIPGIVGFIMAFVVAFIMLVIFHVFNLLLSSLAAFIHSLRLCFVEFLLKFYEGGGEQYTPFHLRLRREVLVGTKS